MKKASIIFVALIVVIAVGFAGYLAYLGAFSTLSVTEMVTGPYEYAYEEHHGDYKESAPVFDRVYKTLQEKGIPIRFGFGVFFDDPAAVPADRLRSHCGMLIERKDISRITGSGQAIKTGSIGVQKSMVVEFPIKGSLSYMIGPMRAYPAIAAHAKKRGHRFEVSYEVYDGVDGKIYYIAPISAGTNHR